jgi:hypothetical protein
MYKIIIRSIFYHWLVLFIGISIGIILNSEWIGHKYILIERSINNIFFPLEYNENIENFVKETGKMKIWISLDCPENFTIIHDLVKGEEFYWAVYTYKNKYGKTIKDIGSVRIKWKTWEYYYKIDEPSEPVQLNKN